MLSLILLNKLIYIGKLFFIKEHLANFSSDCIALMFVLRLFFWIFRRMAFCACRPVAAPHFLNPLKLHLFVFKLNASKSCHRSDYRPPFAGIWLIMLSCSRKKKNKTKKHQQQISNFLGNRLEPTQGPLGLSESHFENHWVPCFISVLNSKLVKCVHYKRRDEEEKSL